MTFLSSTPAIAVASRPWLTRRTGECAFPVAGEGGTTRSCCNPCGVARYCPPHAAAMRGPTVSSPTDFEREIIRFLEARK